MNGAPLFCRLVFFVCLCTFFHFLLTKVLFIKKKKKKKLAESLIHQQLVTSPLSSAIQILRPL